MASTGYKGHGVTLSYKVGTVTSATNIAQVRDISGPTVAVDDIDISNADSTGGYKEYIPGMKDGGEVSFDVVYQKANAAALHSLVGVTGNTYVITLPDNGTSTGSTLTFGGYVKSIGSEVPYNDAITCPVAIKVNGAVTLSTAG